ncbi:MAG: DotD/TraH family lipoprotein [Candidatus Competibacteraceae bacterium]|nr:DotD/TraH family lipoprotein [Candidatus Competibacteraceae bacterium]
MRQTILIPVLDPLLGRLLHSILWACALFGVVLGGSLLAGCATPPAPETDRTPVALELQRAALDAKAALWQLSAIQQAKTGTGLGILTTPAGLETPVSIAWVGPYQDLIATLAQHTGYRYERWGQPPVNSIIVRVNAEHIPAVSVLRDASWQVRDRASLEVDEPQRTLRVRFHHAD